MSQMLEMRLLGGLALSRNGQPLELPKSRQARALLAYLVAAEKSFSRDHLCDLLWDTPSDPKAALRWSLTKLRPLVDEPGLARLTTEGDRIGFNREGARLDIDSLESLAAEASAANSLSQGERVGRIREALALCGGVFLEGLEMPDCHAFQSWCLAQREKYRTVTDKLHEALNAPLAESPEALSAAQAWVAFAPASEAAHAAVMRAFKALGRNQDALDQFRRFDALCRREGGSPGAAIEALRRGLASSTAVAGTPGVAGTREVAGAASMEARPLPALVGRDEELQRLREHAVKGAETLLLLKGEPGVGKTRLLAACRQALGEAGYPVSYGTSHRSESMRVYGPWLDALAGHPALDLFDGGEGGSQSGAASHGFFEKFAAALRPADGQGKRPVFIFDDIQWMDPASFALLHYCLRRRVPVTFLAAARAQDLGAGGVREFRSALLRESMLEEMPLESLSPDALGKLLGTALDAEGRAAVIKRSGGNPLFALELARTGGEAGGTLESIIDSQLEKLPAAAQGLLPWMAALDRNLHLDLLARVSGSTAAQLIASVEDLEKAGIVVPAGNIGVTQGPELAFRHELFRQAAYARISAPRLRLIHRHIAQVMREFFCDLEIAERARHAFLGEDWDGALHDYAAAARRAFALFANHEAVEMSLRALEAAEKAAGDNLGLQLDMLKITLYGEQFTGQARDYVELAKKLARSAEAHHDKAHIRNAMACLAASYYQLGQWKEMGDAVTQSLAAAPKSRTVEDAAHLADLAACFLMTDLEIPKGEAMVREAADVCDFLNARPYELIICQFMLARHAGDYQALQKYWQELRQQSQARKDYWGICYGGMIVATDLMLDDCPSDALEVLYQLRETAGKLSEGGEKTFHGVLETLARRQLGEPGPEGAFDEAMDALRKVDAKTYFTYAAIFWSDLEKKSRPEAVRVALAEAVDKMEKLPRPTEAALARVKWAQLEQEAGNVAAARDLLRPILPDLGVPKKLAKRAVDWLFRTAMELGLEIPTPVTTRVTTAGS